MCRSLETRRTGSILVAVGGALLGMSCSGDLAGPVIGSIEIAATTTGPEPDADGYTITLDGADRGALAPGAAVTITGMAAGEHVVGLSGVADNCRVQGANPRPVSVTAGVSATVAFATTCAPRAGAAGLHWTPMASGTQGNIYAVSGSSATDVFAIDGANGILHYDGTSWLRQAPSPDPGFGAVWASSNTDVFAVGSAGTLGTFLHYDGQQWSPMSPPPAPAGLEAYDVTLNAVWAGSGADVFAIGRWHRSIDDEHWDDQAYLAHYDGTSWSTKTQPGTHLEDVWGSSPSDVFVVGYQWGAGEDDADSFILHYDGKQWSGLYHIVFQFEHVWGSSPNDVYASGYQEGGVYPGNLWHFDGKSWSALVTPMPYYTGDIWGSSASDIYVLANFTEIWHFDGAGWKQVYSGPTLLRAIWGSSAEDVFVVGDQGLILHGTP